MYLFGGIFIYVAFFLNAGPDTGWFNYPPLSGPQFGPGKRADVWAQMITFTEVSALAVAVTMIVTVLQAARAGHDAQPHADLRLGDGRHRVHGDLRDARGHGRAARR